MFLVWIPSPLDLSLLGVISLGLLRLSDRQSIAVILIEKKIQSFEVLEKHVTRAIRMRFKIHLGSTLLFFCLF